MHTVVSGMLIVACLLHASIEYMTCTVRLTHCYCVCVHQLQTEGEQLRKTFHFFNDDVTPRYFHTMKYQHMLLYKYTTDRHAVHTQACMLLLLVIVMHCAAVYYSVNLYTISYVAYSCSSRHDTLLCLSLRSL
jgi:hypothetical protein